MKDFKDDLLSVQQRKTCIERAQEETQKLLLETKDVINERVLHQDTNVSINDKENPVYLLKNQRRLSANSKGVNAPDNTAYVPLGDPELELNNLVFKTMMLDEYANIKKEEKQQYFVVHDKILKIQKLDSKGPKEQKPLNNSKTIKKNLVSPIDEKKLTQRLLKSNIILRSVKLGNDFIEEYDKIMEINKKEPEPSLYQKAFFETGDHKIDLNIDFEQADWSKALAEAQAQAQSNSGKERNKSEPSVMNNQINNANHWSSIHSVHSSTETLNKTDEVLTDEEFHSLQFNPSRKNYYGNLLHKTINSGNNNVLFDTELEPQAAKEDKVPDKQESPSAYWAYKVRRRILEYKKTKANLYTSLESQLKELDIERFQSYSKLQEILEDFFNSNRSGETGMSFINSLRREVDSREVEKNLENFNRFKSKIYEIHLEDTTSDEGISALAIEYHILPGLKKLMSKIRPELNQHGFSSLISELTAEMISSRKLQAVFKYLKNDVFQISEREFTSIIESAKGRLETE